ncbi:E3 ubiquitin-protein ligase TRIM33-like [Ptychodera flava]|uniref:E3 ubiquitin-protein ligase TRIM33-like n=1 Tax=Ptychodera flava TaxID=63121 RepID=UPI003969D5D2
MASSERGFGVASSERETLTCPLCSGSVATLRLLTCGHQLCRDCEQLFGNRNTFSCPLCSADMNMRSPDEMTTSSIEGMVPVLGDPSDQACNARARRNRREESYLCQRCPSHERQNAAKGCIECAEYLCETCSQDHQNSIVSKEHRLLAIEDYESEKLKPSTKKSPSYCTKHSDKVVDVFCQDCRKCVCLRCALTEHPNPTHRYVSPEDAAKEVRERFKPSLQEIDNKRKRTSRAKTTHAKTQRELKKNLKGGFKIIDQHANAIIENVREAQKKAKEEYQNAFSEKEKILSSSQKQIASLDSRLADTIKSVEMKVNFASDTQLLMSEDAITKDMHQLLQEKVDLEPQVTGALYFNVTGSSDVAEFGHIQTVGVSSDTMAAEDSNTMPSATLSVHETLIDNPEGVVSRSVFLDLGNPGQSSFEVTQRETPGNADQTSSVKQAMEATMEQPGNDSEIAGQRSTEMPKVICIEHAEHMKIRLWH